MSETKPKKKRRSKYVTHDELKQAVDSILHFLFAPPGTADDGNILLPDDAICFTCAHRRDEHCGCGTACVAPANDIERAKKGRDQEFTVECKCDGFEEMKT